ncbi:hypothetical protein ACMD2_07959 [Ananas comosus]|uniref:Protein PIN-LIKES 6 n=1 Tax=Ananas comosus TaxID=4615 RepID=A0A199V2X9_ANACO|nr:hypothetical protein ACMD2_07959 [Ananas comosus]
MERSLMEIIVNDTSGGGESILASMKFAVLPIAKVFTVCFMGFLMASKYVNILPANGRKLLNGVASLFRPPSLFDILSTWTSNYHPKDDRVVGAIILYTYVFQMLAPPPGETYGGSEEEKLPTRAPLINTAPEQQPLLTREEPETSPLGSSKKAKENRSFDGGLVIEDPLTTIKYRVAMCILAVAMKLHSFPLNHVKYFTISKLIGQLHYLIDKLKIKQILQPPIVASILAIVIGTIPSLKHLILTDDAPLFFFTDSCLILGEAMIPCILLALGGNLVDGPGAGSKRLGLRTTAAIIFGRLVLVPPAGLGIVTVADKLGFIPKGDKMFKFVLLLQHSMPTSVLSGAVASLRGCGKEAASILFWVHIFAVLSMSGWIVLFLRILF